MMKNKKNAKKSRWKHSILCCLIEEGLAYLGDLDKSPKSNSQGGWNIWAEKKCQKSIWKHTVLFGAWNNWGAWKNPQDLISRGDGRWNFSQNLIVGEGGGGWVRMA